MKIQVIGPGCARCNQLHANVVTAVSELGLPHAVEKVADLQQLLALGVMSTPVLVVDGQVKSAGRVLTPSEVKPLLGETGDRLS